MARTTQNQIGIQKNDTVVIYHMANPATLDEPMTSRVGGHRTATVTAVTKLQFTAEGIRFWNNGHPVTEKDATEPLTETDAQGRTAYVQAVHPNSPEWTTGMGFTDHLALAR